MYTIFLTRVDKIFANINTWIRYSLIISAKIINRYFSGKSASMIANNKKCKLPFATPHITYVKFANGRDGANSFERKAKSNQDTVVIDDKVKIDFFWLRAGLLYSFPI